MSDSRGGLLTRLSLGHRRNNTKETNTSDASLVSAPHSSSPEASTLVDKEKNADNVNLTFRAMLFFTQTYDNDTQAWGPRVEFREGGETRTGQSEGTKCFYAIVTKKRPQRIRLLSDDENEIEVHVWDRFLKQALHKVMEKTDILWEQEDAVEIPRNVMVAFLPRIKEHGPGATTYARVEDDTKFKAFLNDMDSQFAQVINRFKLLTNNHEIEFELLWALFVPGDTLFHRCTITDSPCVVRYLRGYMQHYERSHNIRSKFFNLECERVDYERGTKGWVTISIRIDEYLGKKSITELPVYPAKYYTLDNSTTWDELIDGFKKRAEKLEGLYSPSNSHKHYKGTAFYQESNDGDEYKRLEVDSRIVVDRELFEAHGVYNDDDLPAVRTLFPVIESDNIFITPLAYGYSLGDRIWFILSADSMNDVNWNPSIFENLQLPETQKRNIESFLTVYDQSELDDFVVGKGRGFVLNFSGPPGVGKTLAAEAFSEKLKKPLYTVQAGDMGSDPKSIDTALSRTFNLASSWKAIVLINEADVFLQERSIGDIKRSAVVAVLLNRLEYYRGILILTTNRISAYDPAMKSRIHLSLCFDELTAEMRRNLWMRFMEHARRQTSNIKLAEPEPYIYKQPYNGRQIKNAVKIAEMMALGNQKPYPDWNDIQEVIRLNDKLDLKRRNGVGLSNAMIILAFVVLVIVPICAIVFLNYLVETSRCHQASS